MSFLKTHVNPKTAAYLSALLLWASIGSSSVSAADLRQKSYASPEQASMALLAAALDRSDASLEVETADGAHVERNLRLSQLPAGLADDKVVAATGLPPHPLVEQGYPSIGCSPCTSKVAAGEDPRSGRWKGWDKTECGIHVDGAASELPPGYDPAF